ncbi:MAG: hypothetical protein TREMPRED_000733 [Tremellales sp. Tagirdzhanova-0007]|nr:MAG: hypothetical protein TREMPRED_000733 [Tremellales sp. Tagirdzhanova-0007]
MTIGASSPGDDERSEIGDLKHQSLFQSFDIPRIRTFAEYCPLVAAIIAPVATLLDIPALTQHWYTRYGVSQPDPKASLILSGFSLSFNIFANILLIIRFSAKSTFWWRHSTRWSLLMWLAKTTVALVNLSLFGILTRNGDGYSFSDGFWCAVISVIDAGIICITLLVHYFLAFGREDENAREVRNEGRRFMLSVTIFISILALQSLAFCKIESWAYSDSIYFSVQTALTIGYGDFHPVTTAGRILVFPFAVLTISQLGNEIALIIAFISDRAEARRDLWRKKYEQAMHREAQKIRPRATLLEEMALIHQINTREEIISQMYDLVWSVASLVTFWVIGAGVFSSVEGWTYGDGIYAVMILSLTIGFGDFTPVQPAGKVFFIVYALMAVPIVTSFAVQTITGLLSTYSHRSELSENFRNQKRRSPDAFSPHSEYVIQARESYGRKRTQNSEDDDVDSTSSSAFPRASEGEDAKRSEKSDGEETFNEKTTMTGRGKTNVSTEGDDEQEPAESRPGADTSGQWDDSNEPQSQQYTESARDSEEGHLDAGDKKVEKDSDDLVSAKKAKSEAHGRGSNTGQTDEERKLELDLLKQLMNRTIQLEAEARQMLLDSMDGGVARTLLLADRNVQIRDVKAMRGDNANMLAIWRGEEDKTEHDKKDRRANKDITDSADVDMLSRVKRYRNTFAEILVMGSILQNLQGDELHRFERLRGEEKEQSQAQDPGGSEDMDQAREKFNGVSGRVFRHHAKKLRQEAREREGKGANIV